MRFFENFLFGVILAACLWSCGHAGSARPVLDRAEMAFIDSFTSQRHRVIRMSRAVKEGDTVHVTDGPLVGQEASIRKVNRRKGTAIVEMAMFGRTLQVEIGLAVVTGE